MNIDNLMKTVEAGKPVSASNTYVIYDQYGDFFSKSHLEVPVRGWDQAVEQYQVYKVFWPGRSLGLCSAEYYANLKKSYQKPITNA